MSHPSHPPLPRFQPHNKQTNKQTNTKQSSSTKCAFPGATLLLLLLLPPPPPPPPPPPCFQLWSWIPPDWDNPAAISFSDRVHRAFVTTQLNNRTSRQMKVAPDGRMHAGNVSTFTGKRLRPLDLLSIQFRPRFIRPPTPPPPPSPSSSPSLSSLFSKRNWIGFNPADSIGSRRRQQRPISTGINGRLGDARRRLERCLGDAWEMLGRRLDWTVRRDPFSERCSPFC